MPNRGQIVSGIMRLPLNPAEIAAGVLLRPEFPIACLKIERALTTKMISAAGDGDGQFPENRPGSSGGSVIVYGTEPISQPSLPKNFNGHLADLALQHDSQLVAGIQTPFLEHLKIRVTKHEETLDDTNKTMFTFEIAADILDMPTFTGWSGEPIEVAAETYEDKRLWAERVIAYDPNGLASFGRERWLLYLPSDINDQRLSKLQQMMEQVVTPIPGLKLRPSTLTRGNEANWQSYIDFAWLPRDTKDDIEMPGTVTHNEVDHRFDTAQVTVLQDSPSFSPPDAGGLQCTAVDFRQQNDGKWAVTYIYGPLTDKQRTEFETSAVETDPTGINGSDSITVQRPSSVIPTPPDPRIADLKVVRIIQLRIGGNPVTWSCRFIYGRNNDQDAVELAGTETSTNADHIGETARITLVRTTQPDPPAAPIGEIVGISVHPRTTSNGDYTGYNDYTFEFGNTTELQRLQFQTITVDPAFLDDGEIWPVVAASYTVPTTPTPSNGNLVYHHVESKATQSVPMKVVHVFFFRYRTTAGEMESRDRRTTIDSSDLESSYAIGLVYPTDTPPDTPDPSDGFVFVEYDDLDTNDPLYSFRIFRYGKRTRKQAIEEDESETFTDPAGLASRNRKTLLDATPSVTTGFVSRGITQKLRTPDHFTKSLDEGLRGIDEDISRPGTSAECDNEGVICVAGNLTEETKVLTCTDGDTAISLLLALRAVLQSGTTPWSRASIVLENATKYVQRIYRPADDKKFSVRSSSSEKESRYLDATGTYLKVVDSIKFGTGLTTIYTGDYKISVTTQVYVLRRYFKTGEIQDTAFDNLTGTRNNFSFIGCAAGTVAYAGFEVISNANDTSSGWRTIDYLFKRQIARSPFDGSTVDVLWSDENIARGRYTTDQNLSAYLLSDGSGTPPATVVAPSFVVTELPMASFSPFLA